MCTHTVVCTVQGFSLCATSYKRNQLLGLGATSLCRSVHNAWKMQNKTEEFNYGGRNQRGWRMLLLNSRANQKLKMFLKGLFFVKVKKDKILNAFIALNHHSHATLCWWNFFTDPSKPLRLHSSRWENRFYYFYYFSFY